MVDGPIALATYRQTQGMVIDRGDAGGANSNCRKSVRVDRISIGSANPPNSCLWQRRFWAILRGFSRRDTFFQIYQRSVDAVFATVQIGF